MKKFIAIAGLLLCSLFAFVFLTINVGDSNVRGPSGTLVIPQRTSEQDVRTTFGVFKVVGVFWAVAALACLRWVFRCFRED